MIGQRFGRLMVNSPSYVRDGRSRVLVMCDCGVEKEVILKNLKNGNTKSCGCSRKGINYKHGQSYTRLHRIWRGMKSRCYNPNAHGYDLYGGIGITVCRDWHDFIVFYGWATSTGYRDDLTIDRIDSDLGYISENCRWIPQAEQTHDRRAFRNNTSGYRGVYTTYRGKWQSAIQVDKKRRYLGVFDTKEEAALAWNAAAVKYRGEGTYLNIIERNLE